MQLNLPSVTKHWPTNKDVWAMMSPHSTTDSIRQYYGDTELKPAPTSHYDEGNFGHVTIGTPRMQPIRFHWKGYPNCCGLYMLHGFVVDPHVPQDAFNEIMDEFVSEYVGNCGRFEIIMVETRGEDAYTITHGKKDRRHDVIEPIENPKMNYPQFWNWCHTHEVRDRLMSNPNTGKILHNMEVIFK